MQTHFKIHYKTVINAPLEKVWDALTNPEIVKQYFFGTELLTNWEIGSDIVFQGEWEGQKYKDPGKVLEYSHNEKLAYSYLSNWSGKEDKPENYLWVCYEVKPIDNGTELTISQTNYDEERAKHSETNWASLIDGMKKIIE
ncbi:SRPBCC family protein [Flavobacterium muglaense]|uniref:SRPBCC domain-containing protein n=1 Tax=Flavobacterium muglaense TaxID=2764716 RepID=A0A923N2L5_9FLAO|nr:SRPBCC family protein [Flavobacterium muglaense]MBC5839605.1 SRPBCC domain-containing protein [Flavobacterium muglaense]MBC5846095.1 SRPBCC domain-containing protein [Flavobacterium muglaense]MBC5846097.1 SRPBCC domain-containing protein [Flavobacterium muglaense]